jgi:hypothetical protein
MAISLGVKLNKGRDRAGKREKGKGKRDGGWPPQ